MTRAPSSRGGCSGLCLLRVLWLLWLGHSHGGKAEFEIEARVKGPRQGISEFAFKQIKRMLESNPVRSPTTPGEW